MLLILNIFKYIQYQIYLNIFRYSDMAGKKNISKIKNRY